MEKIWYYTLDGSEKYGPFTDEDLVKLICQGILTEKHYIWMPELSNWLNVGHSIYSFYIPAEGPALPAAEGSAKEVNELKNA